MAKKLTPQVLLTRLKEVFSFKEISAATGYSERQLQRIKSGQTSGAKAVEAIREFYDLGKRAQAATVAGDRQIKARHEAPKRKAPPVEAPPIEAPKEAPAQAPAPPSQVDVTVRGHMGPDENEDDTNKIRRRTIRTTLSGDVAARFASLWEAGETFDALKLAVSNYFGSVGPGYLESVIGTPSVKFIGGV